MLLKRKYSDLDQLTPPMPCKFRKENSEKPDFNAVSAHVYPVYSLVPLPIAPSHFRRPLPVLKRANATLTISDLSITPTPSRLVSNETTINVTSLNLSRVRTKSAHPLATSYPFLQTLVLGYNSILHDCDLTNLSHLTHLDLSGNVTITGEGLVFPALKSLNLSHNSTFSNVALLSLAPHLTHLNLSWNTMITDQTLGHCSALQSLDLSYNQCITGRAVAKLVGLSTLLLSYNNNIRDYDLIKLTSLAVLGLQGNTQISGQCFLQFPLLHALDLTYNKCITDQMLESCCDTLTYLVLESNAIITPTLVLKLLKLTVLNVLHNRQITPKTIVQLINRRVKVIHSFTSS